MGRSHNYSFSPNSSLRGTVGSKEKLIRLNGYPKPFLMLVQRPIVSRWPPRGGLDSKFISPRTPAHDRQGLALSDCYARQFSLRLLIGYSQLIYTCMCVHMNTHVHKHADTYSHTYVCTPIYTSICPPAIHHLPTCHTVAASYLLRP